MAILNNNQKPQLNDIDNPRIANNATKSSIWGDYHTHTVYSHGKGSVEDNVKRAVEIGLKEIGLTDHGCIEYPNNIPPEKIDDFLSDVNSAREKYPDINIYAGVEANLLDLNGNLDMPKEIEEKLDYIIFGYHAVRMIVIHPRDLFTLWLPNVLPSKNNPKRITKNTDAYIKVMEKYRTAIIAHPLKGITLDLKALSEAAIAHNVYLEINEKNFVYAQSDIDTLLNANAPLILNSDAHTPENVGSIETALIKGRQLNIPDELYANWNRLPTLNFCKKP